MISGLVADGGTVYCTNCGEEILPEAEMCPECGEMQGSIERGARDGDERGFTSWGIGFEPGATGRNVLVALAYFVFWYVGLVLLVVGYGRRGGKYRKRAIGIGVAVLALFFLVGVLGAMAPPVEDTPNRQSADGSGSDNDEAISTESSTPPYEVQILYDGSWSGSVGYTADGGSTQESYQGTGPGTITFDGDVDQISAAIQKEDSSGKEMTVRILEDGEVVAEGSTRAEYGVVSVSESFY